MLFTEHSFPAYLSWKIVLKFLQLFFWKKFSSSNPDGLLPCIARWCCALIGYSGTQMRTCLVTSAARRRVVASCFCSGTSTRHLSCWLLLPERQRPLWRTSVMTSSLEDRLLCSRAFLATVQCHRYTSIFVILKHFALCFEFYFLVIITRLP